jgi:hypothetical protein
MYQCLKRSLNPSERSDSHGIWPVWHALSVYDSGFDKRLKVARWQAGSRHANCFLASALGLHIRDNQNRPIHITLSRAIGFQFFLVRAFVDLAFRTKRVDMVRTRLQQVLVTCRPVTSSVRTQLSQRCPCADRALADSAAQVPVLVGCQFNQLALLIDRLLIRQVQRP